MLEAHRLPLAVAVDQQKAKQRWQSKSTAVVVAFWLPVRRLELHLQ
jgi:hypothetical protein